MLEIVGIAGAGKSTLAAEIHRRRPCAELGRVITAGNFVPMSWLYVRSLVNAIWHAPRTKHWLLNVRSIFWLHKTVFGPLAYSDQIFDQGPIFHIAFLKSVGADYDSSRLCKRYCAKLLEGLGGKLTGVVLLEVDFETSLERSHQRQKEHSLKHRTKESAFEFLTYFQAEYNALIDQLAEMGVYVVKIDAATNSEAEVFLQFEHHFSGWLYV